ncbi:uncharacterized protein LOC133362354 [Lethenteron reissneri]|uniref:uncharacterized protein LOC133362354 n=1 Tax=Lethenteron reissneri TaxID=7753 RepID=UPI002AB605F9|nr:uncharacterized protein LOC133362354 [Lethenteron reissneri]
MGRLQPWKQQQQPQLQRHSTGGTGLAGSSSGLSALNRDGFGYRAASVLALERERRGSLAQLEKWMMRSQQQQQEGERWSMASTQTLPSSVAPAGGAPYPDGFTSLPRRHAASSSSLSRPPPRRRRRRAVRSRRGGGGLGRHFVRAPTVGGEQPAGGAECRGVVPATPRRVQPRSVGHADAGQEGLSVHGVHVHPAQPAGPD